MALFSTAEQTAKALANALADTPARLYDFQQRANELHQSATDVANRMTAAKPYSERWLALCQQQLAACEQLKRDYPQQAIHTDHLISLWQINIRRIEQG